MLSLQKQNAKGIASVVSLPCNGTAPVIVSLVFGRGSNLRSTNQKDNVNNVGNVSRTRANGCHSFIS